MANPPVPTLAALHKENEELRHQLREAEDLIHAVRTGAVDALAIQGADGPRIFTLEGADQVYRTLIEQMNEGALLLSQDGFILYGNAHLARLLEYGLEELLGVAFTHFVPADFRARWHEMSLLGWAGKSKGELPLQTKTGQLLPFSLATNVLLSFNATPILAIIVTDLSAQREITEIKTRVAEQNTELVRRAEELKLQEAARYAVEQAAAAVNQILEGIPQIAWTTDAAGTYTYVNQRGLDYIGPANGRSLSEHWHEHLHPADVAQVQASWQQCVQHSEVYEVEFRFRDYHGNYRWVLGRALPSRNEQGEIWQWVGTCTDIHEHKLALERIDQAQRQLQENNAQLTRANIDLDNFIYTASHDLKSPITNIEGLLQALSVELSEKGSASEEVQPIMEMMQDSVDRFKRTIDHLTEIIKLQKEYGAPNVAVDLLAVVESVLLDLAPVVQEIKAQIDVQVHVNPVASCAEKNLRSVVYNLVSNALKYHSPARPVHVVIRCAEQNGEIVLTVEDNGLGINMVNEQKLFAMFQRLHSHVEGSGIGLYMVKKIVENAGGRIEVASQVDVGSSFTVYFPC